MCTVAIRWAPDSEVPLLVGANRDEVPDRPSEPFALRGNVLSPLDVRGGTWVGVNSFGLFAAITNRDSPHRHGKFSRGLLTSMALGSSSVCEVESWVKKLDPDRYNKFNLIVASREKLVVFANLGKEIPSRQLKPGFHVVTGYGINTWTIPRCQHLKKELEKASPRTELFKQAMSFHGRNTSLTAVCLHDPLESHQTRSSCIVKALPDWSFEVQETEEPPCKTEIWNTMTLKRAQ